MSVAVCRAAGLIVIVVGNGKRRRVAWDPCDPGCRALFGTVRAERVIPVERAWPRWADAERAVGGPSSGCSGPAGLHGTGLRGRAGELRWRPGAHPHAARRAGRRTAGRARRSPLLRSARHSARLTSSSSEPRAASPGDQAGDDVPDLGEPPDRLGVPRDQQVQPPLGAVVDRGSARGRVVELLLGLGVAAVTVLSACLVASVTVCSASAGPRYQAVSLGPGRGDRALGLLLRRGEHALGPVLRLGPSRSVSSLTSALSLSVSAVATSRICVISRRPSRARTSPRRRRA